MSSATLFAPVRADRLRDAVDSAARRVADAVAEFDDALDEGCPMFTLVRLDQEVVTATRRHQEAVARLPMPA